MLYILIQWSFGFDHSVVLHENCSGSCENNNKRKQKSTWVVVSHLGMRVNVLTCEVQCVFVEDYVQLKNY